MKPEDRVAGLHGIRHCVLLQKIFTMAQRQFFYAMAPPFSGGFIAREQLSNIIIMRFIVTTENLLAGTKRVQNAVSSKPITPILNNILIEAKDGQLCLTAYDNEMRITTAVSAMVTEEGAITLPAKNFASIVGAQQSGDISIENDEGDTDVRLSCHKVKYQLNGISAVDFPQADNFEEEWSFTIPGNELVDSLRRVNYARSEDENRKALNGIYVSLKDGIRTVAATDGRRLALTEQTIENGPQDLRPPLAAGEEAAAPRACDFILPNKVVSELIGSVDQSKEVKIHLTGAMAVFENGATTIMSKLVEQSYPNYRSVVPVNFANQVTIPRALLIEVLKRAKTVVSTSDSSVTLNIQDNQLELSASSSEKGSFVETIDVKLEGEPITISLNPDYLADPLRVLACDDFVIKYNNGFTPVEITGDPGFIYILMPMRN